MGKALGVTAIWHHRLSCQTPGVRREDHRRCRQGLRRSNQVRGMFLLFPPKSKNKARVQCKNLRLKIPSTTPTCSRASRTGLRKNLHAYVKELGNNDQSMLNYIDDDDIIFKQSAVSTNLRPSLCSILNETCADFFREVIFIHR